MADPYVLQVLGPEDLPLRLKFGSTRNAGGNKCTVCQDLDGTGKEYNPMDIELDASSVWTNYEDLVRSDNLGCTFCGWLAYAIASQAGDELACHNPGVAVCFGIDRSVQISGMSSRALEEGLT